MFFTYLIAVALCAIVEAQVPSPTSFSLPFFSSSPTTTQSIPQSSGSATPACAVVNSLSIASLLANPSATPVSIPAEIGYDCLLSVPISTHGATDLLDSLLSYLQFQSTLIILPNPPKGYAVPGVDLIGGIQVIRNNVTLGNYESEWVFQSDLSALLQSAHDGHLGFFGDALQPITFPPPFQLVSVSSDGLSFPAVYLLDTIQPSNNITYYPSSVAKINGQDIVPFLEQYSLQGNLQDPDALYNAVFFSLAYPFGHSVGPMQNIYMGSTTNVSFADGTNRIIHNQATLNRNFHGVYDGASFFSTFCDQGSSQSNSTSSQPSMIRRQFDTVQPYGYPPPVITHSQNVVGGYYLTQPGYTDVAVLSLRSFTPTDTNDQHLTGPEYQYVVQNFLIDATQAGKTKLVIDLQANGGGDVELGYDTFLQLFPNLDPPYDTTVMRAHSGADYLGQGISNLVQNLTASGASVNTLVQDQAWSDFYFGDTLNANHTPFSSWAQLYGPQKAFGDSFSSLLQENLGDPFNSLYVPPYINITGFGSRSNYNATKPPFSADNIIMITDGSCASTCTIFNDVMKTQAGVKSFVIGGRPDNKGPVQSVGGTRGSSDYTFMQLYTILGIIAGINGSLPQATQLQEIDAYVKGNLGNTTIANMSSTPLIRAGGSTPSLNFKNQVRKADTSLTPLQFLFEAADCRLWYTPAMVNDISEVWRAVAQTAWGNSSLCTPGSTGDPTSLSGGYATNSSVNGSSTSSSSSLTSTSTPSNLPTMTSGAAPTATSAKSGANTYQLGLAFLASTFLIAITWMI